MKRQHSVQQEATSPTKRPHSFTSIEDACLCHWPDCKQFRRVLKEKNHPLGGDPIRTRFANTCNFQNLWHNACINLHISSEEKQHIESAYENIANKSGDGVQYRQRKNIAFICLGIL